MRIFLADNRSKVRFAMRALLEQQPGFRIVGEAADATRLLARVGVACPDLVLLDWELHGLAAAALLPALRGVCPDLCVIALSGRSEVEQAALATGADAFVSKVDPPEQLLIAILSIKREKVERCTGKS